jgi:ATP-dependent RNA helicase DeaD
MENTTQDATGFAALGLSAPLLTSLEQLGYEEPTPIQQLAIPPLIAGRDLLGQAATGTGKTAAFALPLLEQLASRSKGGDARPSVGALVLVPTRELAMQVAEAIHRYGRGMNIQVLPIYGGQAMAQQLRALKRGVEVVVATPGRALDHLRRRTLDLEKVCFVVLDEADEMLDMGFAEDLEAILDAVPKERQTALFSATMPSRISALAERHLRDPERIAIKQRPLGEGEIPRVRQVAYMVNRRDKVRALSRILDMESPTSALVFCRTRIEVDELTETLAGHGYGAEALHGGLSQEQRARVLKRFRDGVSELLVATDVAARGLDIEHLSHVVNFDVPSAPDAYVHRIGRTGRAGREGTAITLAEPRERRQIRNIEHLTRQKIELETVPTVIDLRARRMSLTTAAIREALLAGDLERYNVVVESLSDEFDVLDIATAAIKVAHDASGGDEDEEEITPVHVAPERPSRSDYAARGAVRERGAGRERAPARDREGFADRGASRERGPDRERPSHGAPRGRGRGDPSATRLFVGIGRRAGLRPADLVGAIANEAGIDARTIGAIELTDNFSLVEVPEETAEEVIAALRGTTLRGKRVAVRREGERESPREAPRESPRGSTRRDYDDKPRHRKAKDARPAGAKKFTPRGAAKGAKRPEKGGSTSRRGPGRIR